MFEARFQSFDDPQPAQTGPRVQALRAELARAELSGLILPRADRHQNEYVPPSEERLAWLTGFTGSAGTTVVLADKAALFVDGRYTLAARTQVDTSVFTIVPIADTSAGALARAEPAVGRQARLRPLAAHRRGCGTPRARLRQCRRDARSGRAQSDRHDLDRPAGAAARAGGAARSALRRRSGERQARQDPRRDRQACAPTRWWSPIRTPWPGPSTSAARTSPIRRCRSPSPSCRKRDGRRSTSTARSSPTRCATSSKRRPRCASPRAFIGDLKALGGAHRTVRLDQATGADALSRIIGEAGGKVTRGLDPIAMMKAVKNPVEIEGARAAHRARRRRGDALPRLVRPRGAERTAHRDRRGRGAGKLSPRHRPAQGRVVPEHLRRGTGRRHRALSRDALDRPHRSRQANCS